MYDDKYTIVNDYIKGYVDNVVDENYYVDHVVDECIM
jgi:hypothetical protein